MLKKCFTGPLKLLEILGLILVKKHKIVFVVKDKLSKDSMPQLVNKPTLYSAAT